MTQQPHNGSQSFASKLPDWFRGLSRYERPNVGKAAFQLANTLVPYVGLWALMVYMLRHGVSYWFILPLTAIAAGLVVRLFIFFHDCCHGSFLQSKLANRIVGYVCGVLTFTPYEDWRHPHLIHHSTTGDLDRRGIGDIWTLTVDEYRSGSRWCRLGYRVYRNPVILFVLTPLVMFVVAHRFPHSIGSRRERVSVLITNIALLGILVTAYFTIGLKTYMMIQTPVIAIAGGVGMWLFYVQHQFDEVTWARHSTWDPVRAALHDSSYYRLPKILQWFTGNIGLHHIHHLRPRIPNYNLQRCFDEVPALQAVTPLTLVGSLHSLRLRLWDETASQMVGFGALRTRAAH